MNDIIKNSIKVNIILPTKDCSKWDREKREISVSTELNIKTNIFKFRLRIPTYIFDKTKESEEKYHTNPPAPEKNWEKKSKKFTQNLSDDTLKGILKQLEVICIDSISVTDRETSESEKYIAIKFKNSHKQEKDDFNFASMGHKTASSFQFFVVYKRTGRQHIYDRFTYKSNVRIDFMNNKRKQDWFYYGNNIESSFQLIKWTQEREDFLKEIQDKFVKMNNDLATYLGDINDDKMIALMNNKQFLLTN